MDRGGLKQTEMTVQLTAFYLYDEFSIILHILHVPCSREFVDGLCWMVLLDDRTFGSYNVGYFMNALRMYTSCFKSCASFGAKIPTNWE